MDMFAGPGKYDRGERGSPALVLDLLLGHRDLAAWSNCEFVLLFNELDEERHNVLSEVVAEYRTKHTPWPANVKLVDPESKPFAELANDILGSLKGQNMAPTFAFIDPFGYKGLSLDLIKQLVSYNACELFIYFDFNSVSRFATTGNVDEHFDALFGTDEYKNAPPAGDLARATFLHDLYERQLRTVCNFGHVRSFAMVNDGGRVGNYMFFCTRNLQAFDRMKDAMWALDPTGDYRFQDRLAGQDVLFDSVDATGPLQSALLDKFAGRKVPVQHVLDWVVAQTPYYSGQVKRRTLAVMQRAGTISAENQARKNQFPDGTIVVFPA